MWIEWKKELIIKMKVFFKKSKCNKILFLKIKKRVNSC